MNKKAKGTGYIIKEKWYVEGQYHLMTSVKAFMQGL